MNRFPEALTPLKKALDLDPDNGGTYVQLGRIYHATKNFQESKTVLEEAIQINPFNPVIFKLLTEVYASLGEKEKSQQAKASLDKLLGAN
jgi:predicted Zn-dependent protease